MGQIDTAGTWTTNAGKEETIEAVRAWKNAPDLRERMAPVLQHVGDCEAGELAVVATAESGAADDAVAGSELNRRR
jgi:hypothetical protein